MNSEILEDIKETLGLTELREEDKVEDVVNDSIDIIELIAVLSNKYKIDVQADDLRDIVTIADIGDYVKKKQGTRSSDIPLDKF